MSYPSDISDRLVCVIPTSPVKSHPSTDMIEQTIASVRRQVGPDVFITILADGVRDEQREMLKPYHQHVAQLRRLFANNFHVFIMEFYGHKHQVGMMRWFMRAGWSLKAKPHILFVEHDTPFTPDPIDWENVLDFLGRPGGLDMVRFLYEGDIHPEHRHMVIGTLVHGGQKFIRTKQFSARPHVATWDFYQRALAQFSLGANSFIEDRMHSVCQENPDDWRIGIYYPPPPRGRSFHLDGRQGEAKYDEKQVF